MDILPEGYGFLRTSGYLPGQEDVYVSLSYVRRHQLRKGDTVTGKIREPKNNEKYPALLSVEAVNEMDPERAVARPQFDKLTPLFPDERFRSRERSARDHRADHRHDRADAAKVSAGWSCRRRRRARPRSSSRSRTASSIRTPKRT